MCVQDTERQCIPSVCDQDVEKTTHFLLYCSNCHCARKTFFQKIYQISGNILEQSDSTITKILLSGDNNLGVEASKTLLISSTEFNLSTERINCLPVEQILMIQYHHCFLPISNDSLIFFSSIYSLLHI